VIFEVHPYAAYLDGGVYWKNVYSKEKLQVILNVTQEENDMELTCFSARTMIQTTRRANIFL
jgi:hypothetical protein